MTATFVTRPAGRRWRWLGLAAGCAALLAACGEAARVQEAVGTPLVGSHVTVTLTGNASVTIPDPDRDVTFAPDDAGLLVIHLTIRSTATEPQIVAVRASLYDAQGRLIGDASGGTSTVNPGAEATFDLTGPLPNGTIDHATFEVYTTPPPGTPLPPP